LLVCTPSFALPRLSRSGDRGRRQITKTNTYEKPITLLSIREGRKKRRGGREGIVERSQTHPPLSKMSLLPTRKGKEWKKAAGAIVEQGCPYGPVHSAQFSVPHIFFLPGGMSPHLEEMGKRKRTRSRLVSVTIGQ